jgi:putative tricarboxylic transport membrane protein
VPSLPIETMTRTSIGVILVALVLAATGCTVVDGTSTAFPDGPVNIIVGYARDGGSDQWARAIAAEAERTLGVEVTVTNIVGDGGLLGLQSFLEQPADGYTLMSIVDIYAAARAKGEIEAEVADALLPLMVGNIAVSEIYISANDARFSTWDDVVVYARANPGLTISSAGVPLDLEGLSIRALDDAFDVGFERRIIESSVDRFNAPIEGVTDLLIEQSSDVQGLVANGTLRPILTLWRARTSDDVPAVTEYDATFPTLLRMRGLAAHSDTPQEHLDVLRTALDAAFESESFQQYLIQKGLDAVPYPSDAVEAWREQVALYTSLLSGTQMGHAESGYSD